MKKRICILFDIDGTLIDTGGAGRSAFGLAVKDVLEIDDDLQWISFAGATDLGILEEVYLHHGCIFTDADVSLFFDRLEYRLHAALTDRNVIKFTGVTELLEALAARDDVLLGLLTGNAEKCARVKLLTHALHDYFSFGGYGSEFADRNQVARLAHDRAVVKAGHHEMSVWVVGDTPKDVAAAQAIGAKCLAVTTGRYDARTLHEAGADVVVDSFCDTDELVAVLTGVNND